MTMMRQPGAATAAAPSASLQPRAAALMCRVAGGDPQRRKVSHASFFGAVGGISTLTNSATLFLAQSANASPASSDQTLQVYALCSADIIVPFLHPSSRQALRPQLLSGTRIDVLLEAPPDCVGVAGAAEDWWACELHCLGSVDGVDAAIDVLSQSGPDWELGWSKPNYPPPLYDARHPTPSAGPPPLLHDAPSVPTVQTFGGAQQAQSSVLYPNGRRRSAAQVAVLKVLRRRSELDAETAAAKSHANAAASPASASAHAAAAAASSSVGQWPAHYPPIEPASFPPFEVHNWVRNCCGPVARGTPVSVTSSPYGLLSSTIFHNSLTRGIVANSVSVPDRPTAAAAAVVPSSSTSFFGRGRTTSPTENTGPLPLLHTPPALLLLDARCFSGSEGAPVLLGPGVHPCHAAGVGSSDPSVVTAATAATAHAPLLSGSTPAPLLGMVTLPLRHTARGSAVELTLAIPAPRIHSFLASTASLDVWTPPRAVLDAAAAASAAAAPSLAHNAPARMSSSGRGEGWRLLQGAGRSAIATAATASNGFSALLTSSSGPSISSSLSSLQLAPQPAASAPRSSRKAASVEVAPSPPAVPCAFPSSLPASTVKHAERSVLMARIGSSWASAVVLTECGYLLTNAHLLRPFVLSFAAPLSSSCSSDAAFAPSVADTPAPADTAADAPAEPLPLLFGSAIHLQSHAKLTVRIEAHHLQTGSDSDSPPSPATQAGRWMPARVVYISQGAWDVALLKVDCSHPLHPVSFHPASLSSSAASASPCDDLPAVGSNVLVIGHALFSPASALLPTVTAGILSKVVRLQCNDATSASASIPTGSSHSSTPALLCSTAAVHNGNSGGLLVHELSGVFLGMVTSNVMHTPLWPHQFTAHVRTGQDSGADEARIAELRAMHDEAEKREEEERQAQTLSVIMPHLNFTTPYTALLPLRQFCLDGAHDVSVLEALDASPPVLSRLWQLQELETPPVPQPKFSTKYQSLIQKLEQEEAQRSAIAQTNKDAILAPSKM